MKKRKLRVRSIEFEDNDTLGKTRMEVINPEKGDAFGFVVEFWVVTHGNRAFLSTKYVDNLW